jgi:DnaK suppressor protein
MRDDIDLAYFKQRLEERLTVIVTGQEARKEESPVELDQTRVGRLSRMDAMQQQAMTQATARLSDAEGQRIQAALRRLDSGGYGFCLVCEEEISEGRLRFDPSMLTCISCARQAEAK